ncbi:Alpha-amylase A type-3-like protein 2 [Colletotrichum plurivorum]|uniref:alpha-amylase n=1 Tax=Colletotrichum plurivorum TaxID=2175906 RepID=A0A8H6U528_9PEZI|nr:Alpha-amylase A type-3-like protein 2 [Colletotrichum plurivorum]
MRASTLAWAAASALSCLVEAADLEEWKSRSIYQVMIDRYAHDDGGSDHECNELYKFCGGTWKGLANKLDYIQDMGFTAIQISPIVKNMDDDTAVGEAYHGYWSLDNYAINEKFGTEQDFKDLVKAMHDRDMYIMVDVVVNNMVQKLDGAPPPKMDWSAFNPFNDEKYFHPYCNVTMWENTTDYQDCWLYPYGVALADLATETKPVSDELNKWVKQLVSNYSIDGLRIDAAKHVNDEFLPGFVNASGVFAFGEILTGKTEDFCRYQTLDLLPGMPNYVEYYPLSTIFFNGDMNELARLRSEARDGCTDIFALGSFTENHDMPRFAVFDDDIALAKNALAYILLTDGIPTVYQGQEQHFKGNSTPFNREPLWQSKYDTTAPLYQLTSTLLNARNKLQAMDSKFATTPSEQLFVENTHLCLRKGPDGAQVVFCITNKSSKGDQYQLSVGGFNPGDEVVELNTCGTSTADGTGNVTLYMNKGEPMAVVPRAVLDGTKLCPNGTTEASKATVGGSSKSAAPASFAAGLGLVMASVAAVSFALVA